MLEDAGQLARVGWGEVCWVTFVAMLTTGSSPAELFWASSPSSLSAKSRGQDPTLLQRG